MQSNPPPGPRHARAAVLHDGPESESLAFIVYCLEGGGVQRQTLTLAGEMAARGQPVDYLVVRARGELTAAVPPGVRLIELLPSKGRRRTLKSSKVLDQIRALPVLVSYLRQSRPAVLVAGGSHANAIAILGHRLARAGNRLVLRVTSHMSRPRGGNRWRRNLSAFAASILYPAADAVVAVSEDVRQDFIAATGFDPARTEMIREPVITPDIQGLATEDPHHPWFKAGEPPVILAVGRLSPEKDFETLLRAFARLRRERPARLIILGAGIDAKYAARLRDLALELDVKDHFDLPGYTRNPYAFMARAKVFALSSLWEGCPNVLAEALYCGPAIVATDCPGGVREVLSKERLGTLVPVADVTALASALGSALDNPRPPGTFLCPEGFRSATSVDRYLALFARIAAGEEPRQVPPRQGEEAWRQN